MNIEYVIAIPSYKRAQVLQSKTMTVLASYNIDPKLIYIFVASKEEYDIYTI
jgi:hypothetical protein